MPYFKLVYVDGPEHGYKLVSNASGAVYGFHPCPWTHGCFKAISDPEIASSVEARKAAELQWHLMERNEGRTAAFAHARNWRNFGPVENDPLNSFWSALVEGEAVA